MTKQKWILVISPLFLVWALDRVTKIWATKLVGATWHGPLGFMLHENHGAILGSFSDMPAVLRIVSLSTGGAFLLFLFCIIQFLLPTKSLTLRAGLSFLLGGILGNVADRIAWGYVVDFIVISGTQVAFNVADALQWVGYFMIVGALIKEGKNLWPVDNARKSYWINVRFQLRYCFILMACGLCFSLIAGTFSYTYLNVTIGELKGLMSYQPEQLTRPFLITYSIVTLTFMAMLFVVGMILSHRSAGPLYAFERYMNDYISGKNPELKLRAGDEFMHLEQLAKKVAQRLTINSGTGADENNANRKSS